MLGGARPVRPRVAVRLPPNRLVLFEALVNAIHRAAPGVAIAFNTRPEDTGAAAASWI